MDGLLPASAFLTSLLASASAKSVDGPTTAQIWATLVKYGAPSLCFAIVTWIIARTILLEIELEGPGFTMKAEKRAVALMLSDLLADVRGLTREEKDLFMRIRNRRSRQPQVVVSDLFADFVGGSDAERMLQALRCAHLARPAKGGAWERDSVIQITAFGERLAVARPNLFTPAGQAFVHD